MKRIVFTIGLLILNQFSIAGELYISNSWIQEAPPGINVLAGYLTIQNDSYLSIDLTGVKSQAFESIELHLTSLNDGIATMQKQQSITIPATSSFSFAPGNYHLMLINPVKPLIGGDKILLKLEFSNGEKIPVEAIVKRGDGNHGHSHHE